MKLFECGKNGVTLNVMLRCTGPLIWNALPNDIRFVQSQNGELSAHRPLPLKTFIAGVKRYAIDMITSRFINVFGFISILYTKCPPFFSGQQINSGES